MREADADRRQSLAEAALGHELQGLRHNFISEVEASVARAGASLFPLSEFRCSAEPANAQEETFVQRCKALLATRRISTSRTIEQALVSTVQARAQAQLREARAHACLDAPRQYQKLVAAMEHYITRADYRGVVSNYLNGGRAVPIAAVRFNLDEDLRSSR
jgi:hypothetical protein